MTRSEGSARLDAVLASVQAMREQSVRRLCDWLAIPSVSANPTPEYLRGIADAAAWTRDQLAALGLDAHILPTKGHPAVFADTGPVGDAPTALFYGHYDVQPPDPLDLWTTPAFTPTVREGHVYARGACDDKGQVCTFLAALAAWHAHGGPPCRVKVLIEGEEEVGSVNLPAFLAAHREQLAADVALISDTSMWDEHTVAITYGLRGLVYFDVQLHGPSRDLHSGVYGGTLANPATMLPRVLGRLFDADHRVTIPGFYDGVRPVEETERRAWDALGFDQDRWLSNVGAAPFGIRGADTLTRRWALPSCDINGLYGGYMAPGAKTVIPRFAGAKVSFRIVPGMDPHRVAERFEQWLHAQDTGGLTWKITRHGEAWPVVTPMDSRWMQAARGAVQRVVGHAPALIRDGATIPVVADLQRSLGIDTLLLGFGLDSDALHSPNERFALDRLHLGARCHAATLAALAGA